MEMEKEIKTQQNEITAITLPQERNHTLDNFRGFVIILLALYGIFGNSSFAQANTPEWFRHASFNPFVANGRQTGFFLADIGAPMFMLSMAFAAVISYNKAIKTEGKTAVGKFVRRYLGLIGVGCAYCVLYAFLSIAMGGTGKYSGFLNVLIIFGFAGLLSLPFFKLNKWWRLGIGGLLIILHQCLQISTKVMKYTVETEFGGVIGAVGWAGFFLICTFLGEAYFNNKKLFYYSVIGSAVVAGLFAIGFFLTKGQDITTNQLARFFTMTRLMYSAFYLLFTLFTSVLGFLIFDLVTQNKQVKFLTAWGKSPLFFYLFGYVLYFVLNFIVKNWVTYAIGIVLMLGIMMLVAWWFDKKKIKISV